jgi:cytochrome c-type biogenesis protein CcmH/NrfF
LKALRGIAMIAMLVFTANTTAIVFEQRDFDNAEQLERYKILIYELRCLVCQNQNLAGTRTLRTRMRSWRRICAGKCTA